MRDLTDVLPDASVIDARRGSDGIHVRVEWPDGSLLAIQVVEGDRVHFGSLRSNRPGLYGDLCDTLPAFFKERGIKRFMCAPADDRTRDVLSRRGSWEPAGDRRGRLIWEL